MLPPVIPSGNRPKTSPNKPRRRNDGIVERAVSTAVAQSRKRGRERVRKRVERSRSGSPPMVLMTAPKEAIALPLVLTCSPRRVFSGNTRRPQLIGVSVPQLHPNDN